MKESFVGGGSEGVGRSVRHDAGVYPGCRCGAWVYQCASVRSPVRS